MIKIERDKLASFIALIQGKDNDYNRIKLLNIIDEFTKKIEEYDRKMEEKEIGPNYTQQKIFI